MTKQEKLNKKLVDASIRGNLEEVKSLIDSGAYIHAQENHALRIACYHANLEVVKYLIKNGADIHAQKDDALIWACFSGSLNLVKFLLENGADVHTQNDLPLIYASRYGNIEIVQYLISQYDDLNINIVLESAKNYHQEIVANWCEKYIESNKLNKILEINLKKNVVTNKKNKL